MKTLRALYVAAIALAGASAPIAALTGYYAPYCAQAVSYTHLTLPTTPYV